MTQHKEDLLLELCKPYLFGLLSLISESLGYADGSLTLAELEILEEERDHSLSTTVLETISQLSYCQRAFVLHEIAQWIDSAASKQESQ
jgi:hypothetical protein